MNRTDTVEVKGIRKSIQRIKGPSSSSKSFKRMLSKYFFSAIIGQILTEVNMSRSFNHIILR